MGGLSIAVKSFTTLVRILCIWDYNVQRAIQRGDKSLNIMNIVHVSLEPFISRRPLDFGQQFRRFYFPHNDNAYFRRSLVKLFFFHDLNNPFYKDIIRTLFSEYSKLPPKASIIKLLIQHPVLLETKKLLVFGGINGISTLLVDESLKTAINRAKAVQLLSGRLLDMCPYPRTSSMVNENWDIDPSQDPRNLDPFGETDDEDDDDRDIDVDYDDDMETNLFAASTVAVVAPTMAVVTPPMIEVAPTVAAVASTSHAIAPSSQAIASSSQAVDPDAAAIALNSYTIAQTVAAIAPTVAAIAQTVAAVSPTVAPQLIVSVALAAASATAHAAEVAIREPNAVTSVVNAAFNAAFAAVAVVHVVVSSPGPVAAAALVALKLQHHNIRMIIQQLQQQLQIQRAALNLPELPALMPEYYEPSDSSDSGMDYLPDENSEDTDDAEEGALYD